MMSIKDIPTLKGDNYHEWYKKLELFFIMAEMDWVLTTPEPTEPVAPVRDDTDTDASWKQKELFFQKSKEKYEKDYARWVPANKKCLTVIKNIIETSITGSITECPTVMEYLEKRTSTLVLQRHMPNC